LRLWKAILFQLEIAKTIKNNIPQATDAYCILGLIEELEDFSIKLCKLVDNLLDIKKTVKVAVSFKKINIQCFLTDEEIEFLEKHFKYGK
jgi:hypothetical protein